MLYRGARLAQVQEWAATHTDEMNPLEREFLEISQAWAERAVAEREAQRQRELEAAQMLADTEKARAEDQTQSADRLRIRNRIISIVGVVAMILAVLASIFGLQSKQNAISAQVNAAQAVNAKATAQTESLIRATAQADAEQAAALSFSRELAVQSELNLEVDPERSILLALAGLDVVYTHEAENALHKAVQGSRVRMTLTGHTAAVNDVVFSPDGKRLASSSEDGVRVWDPASGKQLLFLGDRPNASDVAFSPDGSRLAFATSVDGGPTITVRDVNTGQELLTLKINGDDYWMMNFSPDGSLWVGENGKIEFFDATSGQVISTLSSPDWIIQEHPLIVADTAFSADGKRIAVALTALGSDHNAGLGRVEIWDLTLRQRLLTLPENFDIYPNQPGVVAFSPDGTSLATQRSSDGLPAIWDAGTGKKLFELGSTINSLTYSPDGKYILTASTGGKAQMWEATTGKLLLTLRGHQGGIGKVSVSPGCVRPPEAPFEWCGLRLASGSADKTIKIWDISPSGNQEWLTLPGAWFFVDPSWTRVTTFSGPDLTVGAYAGPPVLHADIQNTLHSWALPAWTSVPAAALQDLNYTSSAPTIDPSSIFDLLFRSGKLVAGYKDLSLKIWDVGSGEAKLVKTLCCSSAPEDSGNYISQIDFSSDGRLMAVGVNQGYPQGVVEIWDLSSGQKVKTLPVSADLQLIFSPDGDRLVMDTATGLELWDVATGQKVVSMTRLEPRSLIFSPDGKWLLVGIGGNIAVLDAATLEKKFSLSRLNGGTYNMVFSPDGRLLAATGPGGPVKVWDWVTREELLQLPVGFGRKLQFSPDGTRLMVVVNDPSGLVQDTVRVYVLPTKDIVTLAKSRLTRTLTETECQQYLHVDKCPTQP